MASAFVCVGSLEVYRTAGADESSLVFLALLSRLDLDASGAVGFRGDDIRGVCEEKLDGSCRRCGADGGFRRFIIASLLFCCKRFGVLLDRSIDCDLGCLNAFAAAST